MNITEAGHVFQLLDTLDRGNPGVYSDDVVVAADELAKRARRALNAGPTMPMVWTAHAEQIREERRAEKVAKSVAALTDNISAWLADDMERTAGGDRP